MADLKQHIHFFVPFDRLAEPFIYVPEVLGFSAKRLYVVPAYHECLDPAVAKTLIAKQGSATDMVTYAKSRRAPEVVPPDEDFERLIRELQILDARNKKRDEVFRSRTLLCEALYYSSPIDHSSEGFRIRQQFPNATHALSPLKVKIVSWR